MTTGLVACDDIARVSSGQLVVDPTELVFPKPDTGEPTLRRAVRISNVGQATVLIASVTLAEHDESRELSIVDADDWLNVQAIAPDESVTLTVEWVPLDAAADLGTMTIRHNGGAPLLVPVKTADIDPVIEVTSEPEGVGQDGGLTVHLDSASAGGFQRARIEVSSRSVAALMVRQICFIDGEGECLAGQDDGFFTLCEGVPDTPVDCLAPAIPDPLRFGTSMVFSAFFDRGHR